MGHLIVIHKIKHGWLVIFLETGAYSKRSYYIQVSIIHSLHLVNLHLTNAPDPFKSASYEHTKWVRCGHLNAPHSHVQA